LLNATAEWADVVAIRRHTLQLEQLERLQGDVLIEEFEARRREYPLLVRMMVRAQAASDRAVLNALWREETV
jgi:hypothetical protein